MYKMITNGNFCQELFSEELPQALQLIWSISLGANNFANQAKQLKCCRAEVISHGKEEGNFGVWPYQRVISTKKCSSPCWGGQPF